MNLVQEYCALINDVIAYNENVYDGITAELHNQKVERMCAIAIEIEKNYPELKHDFYELLSSENSDIRLWVAHHILEHMNYKKTCRRCAIKEIRRRSRKDKTACGFGEKIWLRNWYKQHPEDRWL